jgi:hypothetical protein
MRASIRSIITIFGARITRIQRIPRITPILSFMNEIEVLKLNRCSGFNVLQMERKIPYNVSIREILEIRVIRDPIYKQFANKGNTV